MTRSTVSALSDTAIHGWNVRRLSSLVIMGNHNRRRVFYRALAPILFCVMYWTVTMPDGRVLEFVGGDVTGAFRAEDGYTEIWAQGREIPGGHLCSAPGVHWFFQDGFDSGGLGSWE